jgi:two-component system phosphate regulon response regulator PhoB
MAARGVLIIGEPRPLDRALAAGLRQSGVEVRLAKSGREGLEVALEMLPEVVLVIPQATHEKTFEICRGIAANLTGQTSPAIVVLPDPFDQNEHPPGHSSIDAELARSLAIEMLAQCMRILIESTRPANQPQPTYDCHGITLDANRQIVEVEGVAIALTPSEFRLLQALMASPGFVLTRQQLTSGDPSSAPAGQTNDESHSARTRKIDVHVKSIRTKLGEKGDLIETVRGIGYRMKEPGSGVSDY